MEVAGPTLTSQEALLSAPGWVQPRTVVHYFVFTVSAITSEIFQQQIPQTNGNEKQLQVV